MRAVVVFIGTLLLSSVLAPDQSRPEFAGTWRWVSRSVPHQLTIRQTPDELIIETLGLVQGNPADETFAVDGSPKTMIYDAGDFWRKQETTARWEGSTFIGTVVAKARWKQEAWRNHQLGRSAHDRHAHSTPERRREHADHLHALALP